MARIQRTIRPVLGAPNDSSSSDEDEFNPALEIDSSEEEEEEEEIEAETEEPDEPASPRRSPRLARSRGPTSPYPRDVPVESTECASPAAGPSSPHDRRTSPSNYGTPAPARVRTRVTPPFPPPFVPLLPLDRESAAPAGDRSSSRTPKVESPRNRNSRSPAPNSDGSPARSSGRPRGWVPPFVPLLPTIPATPVQEASTPNGSPPRSSQPGSPWNRDPTSPPGSVGSLLGQLGQAIRNIGRAPSGTPSVGDRPGGARAEAVVDANGNHDEEVPSPSLPDYNDDEDQPVEEDGGDDGQGLGIDLLPDPVENAIFPEFQDMGADPIPNDLDLLERVVAQRDQLRNDYNQLRDAHVQLQDERDRLIRQRDMLYQQNQELLEEDGDSDGEDDEFVDEDGGLDDEDGEADDEDDEDVLREHVRVQERRNDVLGQVNRAIRTRNRALEAELVQARADLERLRGEIAECRRHGNNQREEIEGLVAQRNEEVEDDEARLRQFNQQIRQLTAEARRLRNENQGLTDEREDLLNRNRALDARNAALERQLQDDDAEGLRQRARFSEQALQFAHDEMRDLQEETARRNTEHAEETARRNAEHQDELDQYEAELERVRAQLAECQRHRRQARSRTPSNSSDSQTTGSNGGDGDAPSSPRSGQGKKRKRSPGSQANGGEDEAAEDEAVEDETEDHDDGNHQPAPQPTRRVATAVVVPAAVAADGPRRSERLAAKRRL